MAKFAKMKIKDFLLIILLLFSCHKKEKSFYEIKSINKDSSQIIWGNSSFKNSQNFENFVLDKDKIKTKWKNENFIILQRGTGSEAWINLILPIKKNEKLLQTDQVLAFDSVNNIIVRQNYNSEEYPFQLINLKNLEKDSIRFETKNCESINIINCIDKIDFNEKTLIINWTTQNKFEKNGKTEIAVYPLEKFFKK